MAIQYPNVAEALMTILDGWTPIAAADLQAYQDLIEAIETALGAGKQDVSGTTYGPKAANADLADRLNSFLDDSGAVLDVVFITGTKALGDFNEVAPLSISFPKPLSRSGEGADGYVILFDFVSPGTADEGGTEYFQPDVPCMWAPLTRAPDFVSIVARDLNGNTIPAISRETVSYSMLVIGYGAYST